MESASRPPAATLPQIRRLVRGHRQGALSTLLEGRPYASLVTVAFDHDLSPVLLLSGLADHTRALEADPRCALLLEDGHVLANPQTGPRVTLQGEAERCGAVPRLKSLFLARHPAASLYADFADFSIWRIRVGRAHFVGGFARAQWFEAPFVERAEVDAMLRAEDSFQEAFAGYAPDALQALAERVGGDGNGGWAVSWLDGDGAVLANGKTSRYVAFTNPCPTPADAVSALRGLMAGAAGET